MASKTSMVRETLNALDHEPDPQEIEEIAKKIDCSKALVYKVLRRMPKPEPSGIPTPAETVMKVAEQKSVEVPVIEEEETELVVEEEKKPEEREAEEGRPIERIGERFEAGLLTSEDLTYVWQSVNSLFPEKHQRPSKSMEILGKLWAKPANRMIDKYSVENVDLYLAVGVTVLTFAPSIAGMVRERKKKPKTTEESDLVRSG